MSARTKLVRRGLPQHVASQSRDREPRQVRVQSTALQAANEQRIVRWWRTIFDRRVSAGHRTAADQADRQGTQVCQVGQSEVRRRNRRRRADQGIDRRTRFHRATAAVRLQRGFRLRVRRCRRSAAAGSRRLGSRFGSRTTTIAGGVTRRTRPTDRQRLQQHGKHQQPRRQQRSARGAVVVVVFRSHAGSGNRPAALPDRILSHRESARGFLQPQTVSRNSIAPWGRKYAINIVPPVTVGTWTESGGRTTHPAG